MRHLRTQTFAAACALGLIGAGAAFAGTKFQTSLVPNVAGTPPGFSASGSSLFVDGHRMLKGKIKKVVDGTGALVSTDGVASSGDEYVVEVDVTVPATAVSATIAVPFELKKGNGTFSAALGGDPAFAGAAVGDGVAVTGVRVKDSVGTVLGVGGFAVE